MENRTSRDRGCVGLLGGDCGGQVGTMFGLGQGTLGQSVHSQKDLWGQRCGPPGSSLSRHAKRQQALPVGPG